MRKLSILNHFLMKFLQLLRDFREILINFCGILREISSIFYYEILYDFIEKFQEIYEILKNLIKLKGF